MDNYHPNLQPRQGQNGIGNLEHDHIISYLNHNKRLNCGAESEKNKANKEKRLKKKNAKNRLKHQMLANTSGTRFEIVKRMLESVGFTLRDDEVYEDSFLIWSDNFISQDRLFELKSYQHVNHYMGMIEICRKDLLAKNFSKMQKIRPDDYNYFPKTWLFPQEKNIFQKYVKESKNPKSKKYFILKPPNGAMGNGIRLLSEDDTIKTTDSCILQEYIERPFLLDGFKNDLRIYVLVTCCDPLRVFIYREGLVRLSTEKYVLPLNPKSESHFMHLTNYSINKKNSNYSKGIDESSGSKRSLTSVMNVFKTKFKIDTNKLWRSIIDIIVKTLLLVQPNLIHNYKMCRPGESPISNSVCFEILGFDILLDHGLRPWLLEVNRSPSFGIDEKLDKKVKGSLLNDTLRLLNIKPNDKGKCITLQKQKVIRRLTLAAVRSKVDTQLNNEALKKRKTVEKRKQELIDLFIRVKSGTSREYFENRNMGNFTRIFPPEEKSCFDHYSKVLVDSFMIFNQMHSPNSPCDVNQATNQMMQSFMQNQFREEDLLEQIKQCEKEENSLLEKFNLPQNAETTTIIPKDDFFGTSSDEDSHSTSDSDISETTSDDGLSTENKTNNASGKNKKTNIHHNNFEKGQASTSSMSIHRPMSVLSKIGSTKSLKSNDSTNDENHQKKIVLLEKDLAKKSLMDSGEPLSSKIKYKNIMNEIDDHKTKTSDLFLEELDAFDFRSNITETHIYDEVLKIILTALNNLSIRYPDQSEAETKAMLSKITSSWETHRREIATYWLVTLNSNKREKILQIVKNNVDLIIKQNLKFSSDVRTTPLHRMLTKVYSRLSWNRGHGLMQCFANSKAWKLIFSQSNYQMKPCETAICSRVVQLCLDCVLIVHQFSNQLYDIERVNMSKSTTENSVSTEHYLTFQNNVRSPEMISISSSR